MQFRQLITIRHSIVSPGATFVDWWVWPGRSAEDALLLREIFKHGIDSLTAIGRTRARILRPLTGNL